MLPQPPALAKLEQKMLLQLFVNAGNADEKGRRNFSDIDSYRIDRLCEADGTAKDKLHDLGIATLGDMAERQVTHRFKPRVGEIYCLGIDIGRINPVAVREHRPFRRTNAARRVDQDTNTP